MIGILSYFLFVMLLLVFYVRQLFRARSRLQPQTVKFTRERHQDSQWFFELLEGIYTKRRFIACFITYLFVEYVKHTKKIEILFIKCISTWNNGNYLSMKQTHLAHTLGPPIYHNHVLVLKASPKINCDFLRGFFDCSSWKKYLTYSDLNWPFTLRI